jgi:hypothetical protein
VGPRVHRLAAIDCGEAGVCADGGLAACSVGVEGDPDAALGQVHGAGERRDLLAAKGGPAQGQADVAAGRGDADGSGVGDSLHDHWLRALVQEPLAFGQTWQDVALDVKLGVRSQAYGHGNALSTQPQSSSRNPRQRGPSVAVRETADGAHRPRWGHGRPWTAQHADPQRHKMTPAGIKEETAR